MSLSYREWFSTGGTPMLKAAPTDALALLHHALGGTLEQGVGVPCLGGAGSKLDGGTPPTHWTAEHPGGTLPPDHPLALAAEACGPCPVMELCRAAGRSETAGVWGGKVRAKPDREPTPKGTTTSAELVPSFLVAMATRSEPATSTDLIEDVEDLTGIRTSAAMVGRALSALVGSGDALRHRDARVTYAATEQGVLSAEEALAGVGAFAKGEPPAP